MILPDRRGTDDSGEWGEKVIERTSDLNLQKGERILQVQGERAFQAEGQDERRDQGPVKPSVLGELPRGSTEA